MKTIALLGSTGSIGTTALRVLARHPERFRVAALTAFNNASLLAEQVDQFRPGYVGVVSNGTDATRQWAKGAACLVEAAQREDVDIVLNAVVGAAGLDATLAAVGCGKRVARVRLESIGPRLSAGFRGAARGQTSLTRIF